MTLYLLRHGDSQTDESIPDHERALTPEGVASVKGVASAIKLLNLQFDAVYSSPLLRARQTAELGIGEIDNKPEICTTDHLRVVANFHDLLALLNQHSADARLLLVGHEPYFSQLVSTLLIGTLDAKIDIRKASLCCLDVPHPVAPRRGVLKWLLPPQIARRVVEVFSRFPQMLDAEGLTRREKGILNLLVKGSTHKEIAEKLLISPATVRTHLKNIYDKLHVHSRNEAVAKTQGLIS